MANGGVSDETVRQLMVDMPLFQDLNLFKDEYTQKLMDIYELKFDRCFHNLIDVKDDDTEDIKEQNRQKMNVLKENHMKQMKDLITKKMSDALQKILVSDDVSSKLDFIYDNDADDPFLVMPKCILPLKQIFAEKMNERMRMITDDGDYREKLNASDDIKKKLNETIQLYCHVQSQLRRKLQKAVNNLDPVNCDTIELSKESSI